MKRIIPAALAALLATTAANADDYTQGGLVISHPMTFETAPNVNVAGGYMSIENISAEDDMLLEVRVPSVPRVELHLSETDANGVARMTRQDGIPVLSGETVTLQPGGLHVMFMGLGGDPFELGEKITATLVFERAGAMDIEFNVEERGAATHGSMDHSGH